MLRSSNFSWQNRTAPLRHDRRSIGQHGDRREGGTAPSRLPRDKTRRNGFCDVDQSRDGVRPRKVRERQSPGARYIHNPDADSDPDPLIRGEISDHRKPKTNIAWPPVLPNCQHHRSGPAQTSQSVPHRLHAILSATHLAHESWHGRFAARVSFELAEKAASASQNVRSAKMRLHWQLHRSGQKLGIDGHH